AHAYNLKSQRDQERRRVEQGETAYARFVAGWTQEGRRRARVPQRRSDNKGLHGRTFTSCPALCHAVIRARQQISKDRPVDSQAWRRAQGMVKPKPPAAVGCASLDHPLRAAPSKMAGRDGETARLCRTEKLLVDHISRLRAFGFGSAVINVLDGEVELVFMALGTAKLGAPIGQHTRQPDAVFIVERYHAIIEDLGRGNRRLAIIELGKADFGIGIDHGLLIDPADTL